MEPRQRADAKLAEEFVLVEHFGQHTAELVLVKNRGEMASGDAGLAWVVDRLDNLGPCREEVLQALRKLGVFFQQGPVEGRGRAQGQQPYHRPHFEPLALSVGQAQHVIEEAVLLVPHARVAAQLRHGRGDPQEVLDELDRHLGIIRVGFRQFHGDFEHVLAKQGHPGGAVGLLQVAAGRQRGAAIEDADIVEAQEAAFKDVPPRAIFAVDPPGEIEEQLLEAALEPFLVPFAPFWPVPAYR